MPQPTIEADLGRVLRCLEWDFRRLTHANNYYTNGLVVDRVGNPLLYVQDADGASVDRRTLWREKLACISLALGDSIHDTENSVGSAAGGSARYGQAITAHCFQQITEVQKAAGLTPEDLDARLRDDVQMVLRLDPKLTRAHAALLADDPTFGSRKPQCLNCRVASWAKMTNVTWPYAYSVATIVYDWDHLTPSTEIDDLARGWD
jgi:hypothetical protein